MEREKEAWKSRGSQRIREGNREWDGEEGMERDSEGTTALSEWVGVKEKRERVDKVMSLSPNSLPLGIIS